MGAIFKDEARYLDEWLVFHHGVGVDHFYLYNDGSTDEYADVLRPWIRDGLVTLIDWPGSDQVSAYTHCLHLSRNKTRWLALIDIDEFLFSPKSLDLKEVLAGYQDVSALFVYWVLFGSSGHVARPAGPVLESYTRCLDAESALHDDFDHCNDASQAHYVTGWSQDGKSIVNPRLVRNYIVHKPSALWAGRVLDENRVEPCLRRQGEPTLSIDTLRINHYWSKSIEDLTGKVAKGCVFNRARPPRIMEDWLQREKMLNEKEDKTILATWNAIRERRS